MNDPVNLSEKFALFSEQWTPKIVGELNGQHIKLARVQGEFVWHAHENEDELFFVVSGELDIQMRDRTVTVRPGEFYIVPRGVEHSPRASEETQVMLFEPADTAHTGNVRHKLTVEDPEWI
jgi:mannose-6-phosphate isomerase-like protein (cupin superfamily)